MQNSIPFIQTVYNEGKFWVAVGGAFFALFRGIEWIKSIKTNDLHHIQEGVSSLRGEVREQTLSIVTELREMRGDMRVLTTALVQPKKVTRRKRSK